MKNLQTEIDRIVAKEKIEAGLTQGQVSTLARNEQASATSGCRSSCNRGRRNQGWLVICAFLLARNEQASAATGC